VNRLNINKIDVYIQPILRSADLKTEMYEVLMRYPCGNNQLKFPGRLLSISPYYIKRKATITILIKALELLKKYENIKLSINIDFQDIETYFWRTKILKILSEYDQKCTSRLIIEFIEEQSLKNKKTVKNFIYHVKTKYNCKFSLDDFGKGFATFDPLLSYDFDYIKIEKVLTGEMISNPKHLFLIDMLLNMSNRIGVKMIVEHVDSDEKLSILRFMGVHFVQGNYNMIGEASPINTYLQGEKQCQI